MQSQPQQLQQQQKVEKYLANPLIETLESGQWVGSNDEILKSITDLRTLLSEERMTNPELSQQGLGISSAIDRVLRSSQKFICEKNSDEAFQKFFNHAVEFGKTAKNEIELSKGKNNPTALELNERFSDIVDMLRQLVFQIFTSKKERDIVRNVQAVLEKFHDTFGGMERVNLEDIPKDKRDELVKTILNFYAGCEKIPGVKELRNNILSIFDFMTEGLKTIRPDFANEFVLLFDEALTVLDRFTEKNVFLLKTKVMTAFQLISKDKESVEYFTKMRKLSDDLINNPKLVRQPQTVQRVNDVLGQYVNIRNKFYPQLKDVYSFLKDIFLSLQEERYLSDIKFGFGGIGERLRSGSYLGTLIQLKTILAPILTAGLNNAELRPIKQEDETSSWTLSNIHLSREENKLDDIVVTAKIGLKDVLKIKLSIKKIDLHFKDVNFNYERYSVPSWTDSGKLDIRMTSPSWKLKWIVNQKEGRDPFFELQVAQTAIKNLDIEVTQANHTWIDSLLLQLWAPSIRRGAQDSIERLLRERAVPLTQRLNQFFATPHVSKDQEEGRQVLPKAATQAKKLGGEATQVAEKNVY